MEEIKISVAKFTELNSKIERLDRDLREVNAELASLNPEELKIRAIKLAERMSNKFLTELFKQLGFDQKEHSALYVHCGSFYGNTDVLYTSCWEDIPQIDIVISASLYEHFRDAFIKIGVTDKKLPESLTHDNFDK